MLFQYAQQLKEGFFPFVDSVAKVLVPMICFKYHETVRISCISAMPCLMLSAHLHFKKLGQHEQRQKYLRAMWDFMLPNYIDAIQFEPVMQSLNGILDSLSDVCLLLCVVLCSHSFITPSLLCCCLLCVCVLIGCSFAGFWV
jgi:hypothetical protein